MTACAKVRYATRRHARRFARQMTHRQGRLTAYRCDQCGFWHLTSQSTRDKTFFRTITRKG